MAKMRRDGIESLGVFHRTKQYQVGAVIRNQNGWRFVPWTDAAQPSRRDWPTPESAIRRWAKWVELRP